MRNGILNGIHAHAIIDNIAISIQLCSCQTSGCLLEPENAGCVIC